MFKIVLFIVNIFAVCQLVLSFKGGAPASVCQDMTPQHGVPPQPFPSPYELTLNKKEIKAGEKITVTISSPTEKFKGFFVKVVEKSTNVTFGTFEVAANTKLVNCKPGQKNAITHANDSEKSAITITWVAPKTLGNQRNPGKKIMNVLATIAKNGVEFWVGQKSEPFTVG